MLRPDFSEIQENGFRVSQFRLLHSAKMDYVGDNLIIARDTAICYLIEQNEIHFTIFYFALRLMFLFIIAATFSLLSRGTRFPITLILVLLSIIFFLIARKFRERFILGDVGIKLAESIYNSKINEKFNF
jgi:hypothetical protein